MAISAETCSYTYVINIYLLQISCVRQLIKPNIVYKDTTGMTNHMTMTVFITEPRSDSSVSTVTWPRDEQMRRDHSIPDRYKKFPSSPKRLD